MIMASLSNVIVSLTLMVYGCAFGYTILLLGRLVRAIENIASKIEKSDKI